MSKVCQELLNNQDELEEEIKELFQKIDTDHSNEIDRKEFRVFAQKLYGRSGKKVSNETVDKFIKNLDKDKSGTLSLDEFRDFAVLILQKLSKEQ